MDRIDIIKNELSYGIIDNRDDPMVGFVTNFVTSCRGYHVGNDIYQKYKIDLTKHVLGYGEIEDYLFIIADSLGYADMIIKVDQENIYECKDVLVDIAKELYHYCTTLDDYNYYFIQYRYTDWENCYADIRKRARHLLIDNILNEL